MVAGNMERVTSDEEKLRALDAILQSETFARADRLKRLLSFLCEAEMQGRQSELTEYSIGVHALGRPQDFSPIEDSYVRSRAYELRHKLDKFYSEEAPDAPVRIELRKGSYIPRFSAFRTVETVDAHPCEPVVKPFSAPPVRERGKFGTALAALSGAAAVIVAGALWWVVEKPAARATPGPLWTPAMESLWRPFIAGGTPLTIAYENRLFVQMGPVFVRDWHVDRWSAVEASDPLARVHRLFPGQPMRPSLNYTDGGTPRAIFYLTRLLGDRIPDLWVRSSAELSAADFSGSNLIMMGKPHMDPHVERVLSQGALIDELGSVRNVHPAPGEQPVYRDQHDPVDPDRWGEKYAVITWMPGSRLGRRILALTASGSEHPAALAWYMTDPASAAELLRRMPNGRLPDHFQVLVRMEFRTGSPVKVEYVTHRLLPPP